MLLLGASCPTTEPPLPPRLQAPTIVSTELIGQKVTGEYREVIDIRWQRPPVDSVEIASFTMLLCQAPESTGFTMDNRSDCPDSLYSVVNYAIGPHETRYLDRADRIGFPLATSYSAYKILRYRVFAVDQFGRSGDTSAPALVALAPRPLNFRQDSLGLRTVAWEIRGVLTSYATRLYVWDNGSDPLWISSTDREYGGENALRHTKIIPTEVRAGSYFVGAKIEVQLGHFEAQSLIIQNISIP